MQPCIPVIIPAHVKTGDKWYNFNDEQVSQLSNRLSTANPSESHRNYFSVGKLLVCSVDYNFV